MLLHSCYETSSNLSAQLQKCIFLKCVQRLEKQVVACSFEFISWLLENHPLDTSNAETYTYMMEPNNPSNEMPA